MKKQKLVWLVVACFAVLLALALGMGQSRAQGGYESGIPATDVTTSAAPSSNVSGVLGILEDVKKAIVGLQGGDLYAVLIAVVNILMGLFKMEFVQKLIAKLLKKAEGWEMSEQGKILWALVFGIGLAYFLTPSSKSWRFIARGTLFGLAACGLYDVYKFFWKKPRLGAQLAARVQA